MTQDHPITPPPELVEEWRMDYIGRGHAFIDVAIKAVKWGADQELRACCDTLQRHAHWDLAVFELMDDRRPKPPSRKEQALEAIGRLCASVIHDDLKNDAATIRRALNELPDN